MHQETQMIVGTPKEIQNQEHRVGVTPAEVLLG
jgi:alanine dehydrogenase